MKNIPLSIRIIHILTTIVYYLMMLTCGLGVILSLVIFTGILKNDLQLHVEMPVKVNIEEIGSGLFNGQPIDIEIVEAVGKVHFIDTPWGLAKWLAVALIIIFPFLFWLVHLFYSFIRNVKRGKVFEKNNIKLLRYLGYGLLGLWLLMVIYMQILKYTLVNDFSFEHIEITRTGRWFGGIFLGGLFTLVLSQVFLKGSEIEEENELTI